MILKSINKNDYLKSSDLALCVTLCCFGYQIESMNRQDQKAIFSIRKDNKLDNLIQKYWAHELGVDPLSYFNFLKEIKTRIYNL